MRGFGVPRHGNVTELHPFQFPPLQPPPLSPSARRGNLTCAAAHCSSPRTHGRRHWHRTHAHRPGSTLPRWHFPPRISPDGERIAYADSTQTLYTVPVAGGEPTVVDRARQAPITEYAWSPDGRWLAYAKTGAANYSSIFLHDTRSGENHRVTGDDTHDYTPAWDPEGRYLYFLSDRFTNPLLGSRDLEHVDIEPTRPYLALLCPDVENPFADRAGLPPDDEEKRSENGRGTGTGRPSVPRQTKVNSAVAISWSSDTRRAVWRSVRLVRPRWVRV